jgi:hypothetical protein
MSLSVPPIALYTITEGLDGQAIGLHFIPAKFDIAQQDCNAI